MRLWEVREKDSKHRFGMREKSVEDAYECGYEDGYKDAMEEIEDYYGERSSYRSMRSTPSYKSRRG